MHILHLSSAKSWRGGEQQIAYLVEELQKKQVQQTVACVDNTPLHSWCQEKGISHFTYQKRASIDPFLARNIQQFTHQNEVTHLHAHDSHAHTFAFLAAYLWRMKTPILISRRVDFPVKQNFFSHLKYNHSSIRKIVCVSAYIQKVMENAIKDHLKLVVIHSGVDLGKFENKLIHSLREEYSISSNTKIIANVAALADHKDYPTFVRTAELLLKNRNDLHFFIIGGDAGSELEIRSLIDEKKLNQHITLTGYREDVAAILPEIDVFLFTSKEEGLGTSVLDAFACEVPVVATAAGGVPEMILHEKTGYLASIGTVEDLAFGVNKMLDQEEYRQQIVQQAKKQLMKFTSHKMASATLSLYRTVS